MKRGATKEEIIRITQTHRPERHPCRPVDEIVQTLGISKRHPCMKCSQIKTS